MDDIHKLGRSGVHDLAELSPEVHILVESCQEICRGAVGSHGTSKGHLHGIKVLDGTWHHKVHGAEFANETL